MKIKCFFCPFCAIFVFTLILVFFIRSSYLTPFERLFRYTHIWFNDFFFPPLIRCSLRSRLCLCSAKFLYRMGSAYRLHRRTCYTKKEPPRRISEVLKVAATSSPTIFRSAVPSAMLSLCPVLSLLPAPLSAPLSPARRRRAHRTPIAPLRHR